MDKKFHELLRERSEISVRYDPVTESIWGYSNPNVRPCFSITMLKEVHELQLGIIDYFKSNDMRPPTPVKYFVNASQIPGIYNYGGDLNLFAELITKKDRDALYKYAKLCIDVVYLNAVNLHLPITTISLVEGTALGGGFEAALSCNICIAEEQSQMGLPEIRFNLIPGMGAYSFLARSVGIKMAEEIISGGKVYDAASLHEMGVITTLAKNGEGEKTANQYMKRNSRLFNGMQAIQSARHRYAPVDYDELMDITRIWVDAALRLTKKDLKMMQKLVDAQNQKVVDMNHKLRTKQDRRFEKGDINYPYTDSHGNTVFFDRRSKAEQRN
ncbi:MAG: hypothetical protein B5M52_06240 [Helicobacteraceae bacterium 4484_230]|nr:MAG: hypothetical protein B5M52_06240 [Helicobacteraceae bacterium 4484_230]